MEQKPKETVVVWGDSLAKGVIWNDERKRLGYSKVTAAQIAGEKLGIEVLTTRNLVLPHRRGSK